MSKKTKKRKIDSENAMLQTRNLLAGLYLIAEGLNSDSERASEALYGIANALDVELGILDEALRQKSAS